MNEQEALSRMIAPGTRRPGKYREGVIQIHVTRACDKACFGCTQGSNLGGKMSFISPEQFEAAVLSLRGYFGVVGVFGGNPALHPRFDVLCEILRKHIPFPQRGLWCNHPFRWGKVMAETFDPSVSNLNVHLDAEAYDLFKRDWPSSNPFGLHTDSRHSPCYVALRDVLKRSCSYRTHDGVPCDDGWIRGSTVQGVEPCPECNGSGTVYDEEKAWELISGCDINQHWSAMIGVFRGQLRAWFCEIAGAQSILHQDEPDYPDTGLDPTHLYNEKIWTDDMTPGRELPWWQLPMTAFTRQVRKHCHDCGVPLRGHGELAQASEGKEQVSQTHQALFRTKRKGRAVELVATTAQLGAPLAKMTNYLNNAKG